MQRRVRAVLVLVLAAVLTALAPALASAAPTFTNKWTSQRPYGIAADGLGRVFVSDFDNSRVLRYGSAGTFETEWDAGTGSEPMDVDVGRQNRIVIAAWGNNQPTIRTTAGTLLFTLGNGGPSSTPGSFNLPSAIATDRFGFVYVLDYSNHRVQKFSPDGQFVKAWGTLGTDPGQFSVEIWGITVDPIGFVYVSDYDNRKVHKFTSDGVLVKEWGVSGAGEGQFLAPVGLEIGQDNNLYVADRNRGRVLVFDRNGTFLFEFGGGPGTENGQFQTAWDVSSDGTGIYVSDFAANRMQKFTLASPKKTTRVGGADRYDVAVNLVGARWPGYAGIKDVIVVCGEDRASADPLAASGLAGIYDAPLLMTRSSAVPASTYNCLAAIRAANGPVSIHVVGGTTSIPKSVYNRIATTNPGGTIERISGADRYELSAKMALRIKQVADSRRIPVPGVLLFNGQNSAAFYDALAAGPLSAGGQAPMMALRNTAVPGSVKSVLNGAFAGKPRYVVNSKTFVPASVYNSVGASARLSTSSNRYVSAWQIGTWGRAAGWVGTRNVGLANKLPDALTGGAYIGEEGGVLLYTEKTALPAVTSGAVGTVKVGALQGWVFGGPASVSDGVIANFTTVLNTP